MGNITNESDLILELPHDQSLTARLAAAGSVRRELQDLLMGSEPTATQDDYRTLIIEQNVAGKQSDASRKKTWTNLKGRYLLDPRYPEFRAFRAAIDRSGDAQDRGLTCYLMMARTDRLYREIVLSQIAENLISPDEDVPASCIEDALRKRLSDASEDWRPVTIERIWQHILSASKDFGIIEGSRKRRTVAISPGVPVIVFAAQLGRLEGLTDRQILNSMWFRLIGFGPDAAADHLFSAAQSGSIHFRKQADVVELRLPEPGEQ